MRESRERWIAKAILLVLLTLLVPTVALPFGRVAWMRLSRAVVANETSWSDFMGQPVSFLSVGGPRWVSWSEQKQHEAAYHVLLLQPSASVSDKGWSTGNDGRRHTATKSWLVETGSGVLETRFEGRYDALWRTVGIGGQRYSLSDGNVFVVRLGGGAQPVVTQIDTTVAELYAADALGGAVKSRLPRDEAVQRALSDFPGRDDCEPGRAPHPSGRAGKSS